MEQGSMGSYRIEIVVILSLMVLVPNAKGWGKDGHAIVCKIAQVSIYSYYYEVKSNLIP